MNGLVRAAKIARHHLYNSADYRFADEGALAIRVSEGEAAILTSTSLIGSSVQAWVT